MGFSRAAGVKTYLPGSGTPASLNACLTDPTSTSAGVFGGQVLALQINNDFSAAGVIGTKSIGGLFVCNTVFTAINGKTISQVLALANTALGNSGSPSGMTVSDLETIVDELNLAFDHSG